VYSNQNNVATFNNVKITGNLEVDTTFNIIPRGCIIAFNAETAPSGWALCDGGTYKAPNGDSVTTPDLRGRFIRMSYTTTQNIAWGDNLPINLARSSFTGEDDTLLNTYSRDDILKLGNVSKMLQHKFGDYGGTDYRIQGIEELAQHTHGPPANGLGITNYGGGVYTNGVRVGDFGTNVPNQAFYTGSNYGMGIMPPYYVLTYIMKL
jgi:hypothetical protein